MHRPINTHILTGSRTNIRESAGSSQGDSDNLAPVPIGHAPNLRSRPLRGQLWEGPFRPRGDRARLLDRPMLITDPHRHEGFLLPPPLGLDCRNLARLAGAVSLRATHRCHVELSSSAGDRLSPPTAAVFHPNVLLISTISFREHHVPPLRLRTGGNGKSCRICIIRQWFFRRPAPEGGIWTPGSKCTVWWGGTKSKVGIH